MIIVRLIGGLGNQMFQYAAGRRLAHMLAAQLKLDITGFEHYDRRKYSLGYFNIQENFASLKEIRALTKRPIVERVLSRTLRLSRRPARTHIWQKNFHFDPHILALPDGIYLDGYWQSQKYFADIAGIIRREFTVKVPQTGKNKELAEMISSTESVSLHIRRGDYVTNPHTSQVHGTCGLDYYFRCIKQITGTLKKPHFFIFSDDPQWVHENLNLPYPVTLVYHNGPNNDYEDLRLMIQCKHHIIANSSFSWWGAWLNPRTDKIVFAPKQWFSNEEQASRKMGDLFPDGCIVL